MRLLQVNSVYGVGSTGRIVRDIEVFVRAHGTEPFVAYGMGVAPARPEHYRAESPRGVRASILQTRLSGRHGFYNVNATKRLLTWVHQQDPDVIHLHNLHGHYMNVELLFEYLRDADRPVIWTLHDCWPFTGHCAHFDFVDCEKWKTVCHHCPQRRGYPDSWFLDRSRSNYENKRRLFTSVANMTLVTPSEWLARLVASSFLGQYPVHVINNGIDLGVFQSRPSQFRVSHAIDDKFVILGIAAGSERRKGIEHLVHLSARLGDDEVMVLVGATKEQERSLPSGVVCIPRTDSAVALAEIYSAADVFVNPTLEDNFPTVNLEALACGVPVITFETGGSAEAVDEDTGIVVWQGDDAGLRDAISQVKHRGSAFYRDACMRRAQGMYGAERAGAAYLSLYGSVSINALGAPGATSSSRPLSEVASGRDGLRSR